MPYASGQAESLYMGLEASYKTLPGTAVADKLSVISPAIMPNVSEFTSQALSGSPSPRPNVYGKVKVGGSFQLECSVDSLQMPLRALMGKAPANAGVVGSYDHTYEFSAVTESWFIEQKHADITQFLQWKGNYCDGAVFNFTAEGLMQATFNIVGAQQTVAQATIINSTITDQTSSSPIEYMAATVTQAGSSLSTVAQTITLNMNRNLTPILAMDGTNQLVGYAGAIASFDGTLTTLFSDNTLLDLAMAGTETSLSVLCPAPVLGLGLKVIMPTLKFRPTGPTTAGAGLNTVNFAFKPYAKGSASNVPGQAQSKYLLPTVTIGAGTTDSLKIKIDGAAAITVTLTAGARTPTQLVSDINTAISATGTASVENGRVVIKSKATTGSASSVQIDATGTAQTVLGFDTVLHSGYNAAPIIFVLTNTQATA